MNIPSGRPRRSRARLALRIESYYFIENGVLRMCNESGEPNGVTLEQGDDPNQIARRFTRDAWRKRAREGDFNRPLRYRRLGVA